MNRLTSDTCWCHGSPLKLRRLRAGSSVAPNKGLAVAFSHHPTPVSVSDDGRVIHDGTELGYLYRLSVPVDPGDLVPHPRTKVAAGEEFLTTRELPLTLLGVVPPPCNECVSQRELAILRRLVDIGDQ